MKDLDPFRTLPDSAPQPDAIPDAPDGMVHQEDYAGPHVSCGPLVNKGSRKKWGVRFCVRGVLRRSGDSAEVRIVSEKT